MLPGTMLRFEIEYQNGDLTIGTRREMSVVDFLESVDTGIVSPVAAVRVFEVPDPRPVKRVRVLELVREHFGSGWRGT